MIDEQPPDVFEVLGKVSGLGRSEAQRIFAEVKANSAKLNACPRHDFHPMSNSPPHRRRFQCTHCQGELTGEHVRWYALGLAHGAAPA